MNTLVESRVEKTLNVVFLIYFLLAPLVLLHSNLLHGGGENIGDATRVSIEVRILDETRLGTVYAKFDNTQMTE